MNTMRGTILGAALFLAACFSVAALAAAEDKAAKEAAETINKLADSAGKKEWAELSKTGAELAKKHVLLDVMHRLKKRDSKARISGLGVGDKPGEILPDGIEAKIINMRLNPMDQATLEKDAAALIRMAERTAAIAAVSVHLCPVPVKKEDKDPEDWKKWSEEMFKNSHGLIAALKKKDVNAVKDAAKMLNSTCNKCHGVFKD